MHVDAAEEIDGAVATVLAIVKLELTRFKGYASKVNRDVEGDRGVAPDIPFKVNEKDKSGFFASALCRGRARIEQAVGKLKRFKHVAQHCEKTECNFTSIVALAAAFILHKSIYTT